MKVGRRSAVLLAVVLAVALSLIGSRSAPAAHASAKAAKLTIWVDNVQKPAVDKITSSWGTRRGVDVNVGSGIGVKVGRRTAATVAVGVGFFL